MDLADHTPSPWAVGRVFARLCIGRIPWVEALSQMQVEEAGPSWVGMEEYNVIFMTLFTWAKEKRREGRLEIKGF